MKTVGIKIIKLSPKFLAVLTAVSISVSATGCDINTKNSEANTSKEEASSSVAEAPVSEVPVIEASSSEAEAEIKAEEKEEKKEEFKLPEAPEIEYSEWVLNDWTTEQLEESDTCRLVDKTEKQQATYGPWSEWTATPIEQTNTRQVEKTVKKDKVIKYYIEVPVCDQYGWQIPGKYATVPAYEKDENGYWVFKEQTYYRSRDLSSINSYTLYQYETREIINQAELDDYNALVEEYENRESVKKTH